MAKKKSTKATAGKKKTTTTPPKAPAPRKPKAVTRILRPQERARLPKPTVENYEEIAEEAVRTWLKYRKVVHVFGLTPSRLAGKIRNVKRTRRKQEATEQQLQKDKDARLMTESDAWKSLLDLKASVENASRQRPDVLGAFADLVDILKKKGRSEAGPTASDAAAGTGPKPETPTP